MALAMTSMAGLCGSSPAVLKGSLQSNRLISRGRTAAVARTGFNIRASSAETETETSRRAMLGLVAAGIVSGSFVQAVLAEAPNPFGALPAFALGEYTPIPDLQAPEVIKIADFAVAEHNKEAKSSLVLESVLRGESQVVAGKNYRLVISAKDSSGGATNNYLTVVYSGLPPKSSLELTSFKPLYR